MTATIEQATTVAIPRDVLTADLGDRAFRVYCLLRSHDAPLKNQAAIAREFGLSEHYVSRAVRELTAKGLLSIARFDLAG